MGGPGGGSAPVAVPVEVVAVERRGISTFIETNGVLEAENEVDLVARVSAPIVELLAEEGMAVRKGQTLARLDDEELRAQVEISRVALNEATLNYERAKELNSGQLISVEEYERANAAFESARAQLAAGRIQLEYADIRAPFDGLIVARYIDLAQQVSPNTPMFRISDFDPLLCPIQVPERELPRLRDGQRAYLTLEPWPDERFEASVLRIRPVVDAATGTVKVTLIVRGEGKLRPGMFARVFVETARRPDTLVIPKAALSLDSIGDTVYVADGAKASRREITLGFREGGYVEVRQGVAENEAIIVVGQDGLSDGTPIQVLGSALADAAQSVSERSPRAERLAGAGRPERSGGRPDFASMSPEQLERVKARMRERGMSEEQIAERLGSAGESTDDSERTDPVAQ